MPPQKRYRCRFCGAVLAAIFLILVGVKHLYLTPPSPFERPRARQTRVIHQYPAPAEPWYKKPYEIVALGMVVTVVGGLLLHLAKTLLFTNAR